MVELSIVAGYFLVGTIWGTTNAAMEIGTQKKEEEEKKMAEKGQHGPAKILSKDVARQRQQKNQYLMMGS